MRFSYDPETDSLYIHLSERTSVDSEEVAPDVVLDFDEEGRLVGLDIQHASVSIELSKLELGTLPVQSLILARPEAA